MLKCCRPLGVEVYKINPTLLEGWKSPEPVPYEGIHGIQLPQFEPQMA